MKFGHVLAAGLAAILPFAATSAQAFEDGKLTILVSGDKGFRGMQAAGDKFEADTGIKVVIENAERPADAFIPAATAGSGPDVFIFAHDRTGELAKAGLLAPVTPSAAIKADVIDTAWDAFTYGGKIYGYPIAVESVGLIYNKDIIAEPPKSFEEMHDLKASLSGKAKHPIIWAYTIPYFSWPVVAAGGAEPFKTVNGEFDPKQPGVNDASAVANAEFIVDLINKDVMPKGVTYPVMEAAMIKGETAMMISGPWAWSNLRQNNINFGVAPLPTLGGKPAVPFVGVQGAMLNAASPNKDIAAEFIENYLMSPEGLRAINDDVPIGVPASKAFFDELKKDEHLAATMANVENGKPMPNIPELSKFWEAMEAALNTMTAGSDTPASALETAAKRIAQ